MRRLARTALSRRLERNAHCLEPARLRRPTLVMAPHPDDETLACGGLVIRLRDLGTPVTIAFLTNGAASHANEPGLAARRRSEATSAAAALGVAEADLHFLEYPDGGLEHHEVEAAEQISALLGSDVDQVVLPHPSEPNRDHAATHRIGRTAADRVARSIDSLQFGVWVWDQWPWTNPLAPPRSRHGRRQMIETMWRGRAGFANSGEFRTSVDVADVLDRKRAALECHASQVARDFGHRDRLTLADVANGEWLELLLGPIEYFRDVSLGPVVTGARP